MTTARPSPVLSQSAAERLAAVDRAVALGAAGVPELLSLLNEPSWPVRRGVIAGLAALGEPAIPGLLHVLRSQRDDEARIAAAVEALSASTGAASEAAESLAQSPDPAVACDGVQVLGRRRASSALPLLERLSDGEDDNVAVAAIEALGRIGGSGALESVAAAARSGRFFRVFPAIDVLGNTGDPRAVAPLSVLLEQPLYTAEAANALGRTGESAAVLPLSSLLSREGPSALRTFALSISTLCERSLERHGTARAVNAAIAALSLPPGTLERLRDGLVHSDPAERVALCVVLGALGDERSIAMLVESTECPPPVGPAAVRALQSLGPAADAEIARQLSQGSSARRLALLPLVARKSALDVVFSCLRDPDPTVRARSCEVFARLGDPSCLDALFLLLADADAGVVQAAGFAIQSLGAPQTEHRCLMLAESGHPGVRRAALRILAYFGFSSALGALTRAAQGSDARLRDVAIQGLALVEAPEAGVVLLELAADAAPRTRAYAMKALGHRDRDDATFAVLIAGLQDLDSWVRYYACQALGRWRAEDAAPRIAGLLSDEAGHVRIASIEALAAVKGPLAHELLVAAAEAPDPDVRRAALVGLGLTEWPGAIPTLLDAAASTDVATRLMALAALARFDHPAVFPVLARAATDPEEAVRGAAIGFLGDRPGDETAIGLIGMLADSGAATWVVPSLASRAPGRAPAILAALAVADDALAGHLVAALARMQTAEGTAALYRVMASPAVPGRKAAATALGAVGSSEAIELLRRAATNDPDAGVRRIASLLTAGVH